MGEGLDNDQGLAPAGSGMQSHKMFPVDGPDWGIWRPSTVIEQAFPSEGKLVEAVLDAIGKDLPLSLNFLMYEDGSLSPETLRALRAVRQAVRGGTT